jgi:MFS superfamily sulfate permease-like transporter
MSSIDTTAAEMLLDLVGGLHAQPIVVGVARANAPLRTAFEQTGLARLIGAEHFYPSVRTGVETF